jgi:hypothetical protein
MPLSSPPGGTDHGNGDRPELVTAISGLHSQQRQVCRQALFRAVLGDIREDLAELAVADAPAASKDQALRLIPGR